MTRRTYGQFCGLARALEMVGERWSLLVVRDLVLSPKRFTDLQQGLPRIPSSILSARLNELEDAGVLRRRVLPQLDAAVIYELTEYGSELEQIVLQLGRWGARSLGEPDAEDAFSTETAILALYATFRPESAHDIQVSYELRFGPFVLHALVNKGELEVAEGEYPEADLIVSASPQIRALMAGEVSPFEALENGTVEIEGDPALLSLFTNLFQIDPAPTRSEVLAVH